jgi:hypothetical protein
LSTNMFPISLSFERLAKKSSYFGNFEGSPSNLSSEHFFAV